LSSRLCLVTGASSGIGQALARVFAARGYDLAITARRVDRLQAFAAEIRQAHGRAVIVAPADLSQPRSPDRILNEIARQGRAVDVLVNNAGYGLPGAYYRTSWEIQSSFLQLMVAAPAELTHKTLPGMVERGFGRVLNVASMAGLTPGSAGHTLYAAAKSFMIKSSESLYLETRAKGVHVTALCPGFTRSEFHDANRTREKMSRLPKWMWLSAEEVAEAGYAALEANRPICVPGLQYKAIATLARMLPPRTAINVMARQSRRFRDV